MFELGRDIDEIFCVFDFGSTSEVESEELFGSGGESSEGSLRSDRCTKARGEGSEHVVLRESLEGEKREDMICWVSRGLIEVDLGAKCLEHDRV